MKGLARSPLFWIGLVLKLAAIPFFASSYLESLFVPFLELAVANPGVNPWTLSPDRAFPYGGVLFMLLYASRLVVGPLCLALGASSVTASIVAIKVVLLAADLAMLAVLVRLVERRTREILALYWLSPVAFYISYIHGQLDVVSMALVLASMATLLADRVWISGALFGAAVASKFHVALVGPLFAAYVWRSSFRDTSLPQVGRWTAAAAAAALCGMIPVILAGNFGYVTLASPEAGRLLGLNVGADQTQLLYVGFGALMLVFGRLILSISFTPAGLVQASGALFAALLVITQAMPGWYMWVVPFFAAFHARYEFAERTPFLVFTASYLVYFALRDVVTLPAVYASLAFTALQFSVVAQIGLVWYYAVRSEAPFVRRLKPFFVGIAGDSGVGKNRLTAALASILDVSEEAVLEGDDYHKWERGYASWQTRTHLSPHANRLGGMAQHAAQLSKGQGIDSRPYDHSTGRFGELRRVRSAPAVIVQGLHTFYVRGLRDRFELKVFLEPEESVRVAWKIARDVKERGHDLSKVLDSVSRRVADARLYVQPQRQHADWIIQVSSLDPIDFASVTKEGTRFRLAVRHVLWNDAPIEDLVQGLEAEATCSVAVEDVPDDVDRIALVFTGTLSREQVERVARHVCPDLRAVTGRSVPPEWHADLDGLNQLVALVLLRARQVEARQAS